MSDNTIATVVAAFKVLKAVSDNRAPMRQAEIAAALEISRPQALRYCETLVACRLLEEIAGAYALGSEAARLHARYVARKESQIAALQRDLESLGE